MPDIIPTGHQDHPALTLLSAMSFEEVLKPKITSLCDYCLALFFPYYCVHITFFNKLLFIARDLDSWIL